ncbi:helix-turn-helix domain-containing protein [Anaerotignum sp.]|uniref:helix-turn-helix domain-containing protein n=1 Tax=Anaerotignum sp. TaxID=2039241 RepID=UPI0028A71DC8|nr:helix-turn-helix transcriptional regulator [Anaerotignum sp.]
MDKTAVGKRLRRHRENLGLSREEYAEQISISPQFLAEIENGKKGMSAETLYKICENHEGIIEYLLMGRQNLGTNLTPAAQMLSEIPPQYSEMIEDVIGAFVKTINLSDENSKR